MLVLRLLLMVLAIICLMDGHAEVSSSTTEMRNRGGNPATELNKTEIEILDRKKKKPKPGKKKKPKPKPGKKAKPTKPGKNSCTLQCPTGYPETSDRGPLYILRDSFTVMMTKHCANECKKNKLCSGFEATKCSKCRLLTDSKDAALSKKEQVKKYCKIVKPTTTSSPTTTIPTTITTSKATSTQTSTASTSVTTTPLTTTLKTTLTSTPPTTITTTVTTTAKPTTKTTPSPPTTPDYGDCEATNGSPCIFPFKDGSTEYNECANERGKYYWCATSVYSSGKYKSWQYCPLDGSCPLPGGECKATNKMPCYFPFKHDGEEYNECIDDGKKLWCATSTTSSGTWNNWGYCPEDGTCPLPPKTTTTTTTTTTTATPITTVSPKESASTSVFVKDGEKVFSCKMDFTFESKSGFKMSSDFSSTCSPASSATKDYKNFEEYAFDITTSSGATINCKINIVIQDESSGISMATKPMEKSLECSVDESTCVTTSGEHFPTSCVVPFIHEGRKYQACTDKGGKDADKLWCATAVDENEEMTKWGYCSTACGYCGGKDVTEQDVRAPGAPCGYDCLINPNKPMEPKTQGINPKLLTAPEVSYYKDEMTDWNLLPNAQVQFRQGEPGVFLKCKDGFNQFPCHDSLYMKCDGNYRFSIYKAEIKQDNTAEIGEFIQNDVKNIQIGCGPCPMGFIYKVGDEVCKYTNCGKYHGVPSIEECRGLCDKRDCPTFVYSLEDKYCELHSVRVENPSYHEFKDYKLCAREQENSCESECSLTRNDNDKLKLICPNGYTEKNKQTSVQPLYLLADWFYYKDAKDIHASAKECATTCENIFECYAIVSTVCKGCQLLTEHKESPLAALHGELNHYCLPDSPLQTCQLNRGTDGELGSPENCGDKYIFMNGQFKFWDPESASLVLDNLELTSSDACSKACDDKGDECKSFYFYNVVNCVPQKRCYLLKIDTPQDQRQFHKWAFCRKRKPDVSAHSKQYRCYSYNDPASSSSPKEWVHRYMWHHGFRITLFSTAKITNKKSKDYGARDKNFMSEDWALTDHPNNPCGGQITIDSATTIVPGSNEFDNNIHKVGKGHILKAEFILSFFPGSVNSRQDSQNYKSIVFPQDNECDTNPNSVWTKFETKYMAAAEVCTNNNNRFHISQGLLPSITEKVTNFKNIQKVDYIYTNYCCIDGGNSIIDWYANIIDNPQNKEGAAHIDCTELKLTSEEALKKYHESLAAIDKLDINLGTYEGMTPTSPFKYHKDGKCIIGIDDSIQFADVYPTA